MMQTDIWPNKDILQKPREYVNINKESQLPISSYVRTKLFWKIHTPPGDSNVYLKHESN